MYVRSYVCIAASLCTFASSSCAVDLVGRGAGFRGLSWWEAQGRKESDGVSLKVGDKSFLECLCVCGVCVCVREGE